MMLISSVLRFVYDLIYNTINTIVLERLIMNKIKNLLKLSPADVHVVALAATTTWTTGGYYSVFS